ncbi:hypothetical protein ACFUGD_01135 [Streptomyces sp. NPDC057217]|uniref:hypothetical protein n=1 Tax=Streptomyces sp. NPDC057217 TaxID=3346054 RepID=UPI00363239A0
MVRYRVTAEGSRGRLVAEETCYRLLRTARTLGWERTPVARGYVVTLPSGTLVAVLREER